MARLSCLLTALFTLCLRTTSPHMFGYLIKSVKERWIYRQNKQLLKLLDFETGPQHQVFKECPPSRQVENCNNSALAQFQSETFREKRGIISVRLPQPVGDKNKRMKLWLSRLPKGIALQWCIIFIIEVPSWLPAVAINWTNSKTSARCELFTHQYMWTWGSGLKKTNNWNSP